MKLICIVAASIKREADQVRDHSRQRREDGDGLVQERDDDDLASVGPDSGPSRLATGILSFVCSDRIADRLVERLCVVVVG